MVTRAAEPAHESAANSKPLTIGVLALQGDYDAHARAFTSSGARTVLVRKPDELASLDGLVIPGGESTTMLKFLEKDGFFDAIGKFAATKPVFATCAGCILLAREVLHPKQRSLGVLDATVERNAYGRQIDSSIQTGETALPGGPLEMVFIRSPRITRVASSTIGTPVTLLMKGTVRDARGFTSRTCGRPRQMTNWILHRPRTGSARAMSTVLATIRRVASASRPAAG